jgi:hypothetical protein
MTARKRPGAHDSDRAGDFVLAGTLPHTTGATEPQRRADVPCRIVGWKVTRTLNVEAVEVAHG